MGRERKVVLEAQTSVKEKPEKRTSGCNQAERANSYCCIFSKVRRFFAIIKQNSQARTHTRMHKHNLVLASKTSSAKHV